MDIRPYLVGASVAHVDQVIAALGGAGADGRVDPPGSFHLPADPRVL